MDRKVSLCKKTQQDMITHMKQLNEEYAEYKLKNDLDRLFMDGFDSDKRKRLLQSIESL